MITDNFLVGMAKLANNETYDIPAYLTVSSDSEFTATASTDTISSEIGDRIAISNTRSDKIITYDAVRSGAIVSSDGETIYGVALTPSSGGAGAQIAISLPGLKQTQKFDLDFNIKVTMGRN